MSQTICEEAILGLISEETFNEWETGSIHYRDMAELFWAKEKLVEHFDSFPMISQHILENDMVISNVAGGLQY